MSKIIKEENYGFNKEYDLSKADENQYLENFFSSDIEPKYKEFLNKLIQIETQDDEINKKHHFFTLIEKLCFSYYLAIQEIRLKSVRDSIEDLCDMLQQAFEGAKLSPEVEKMITVSKDELPYIHGRMICNDKKIADMARTFANKIWVLAVNHTKT